MLRADGGANGPSPALIASLAVNLGAIMAVLGRCDSGGCGGGASARCRGALRPASRRSRLSAGLPRPRVGTGAALACCRRFITSSPRR